MKAIDYLKLMDREAKFLRGMMKTGYLSGYIHGMFSAIEDMALEDNEVSGMDFSEILSTKRDYIKEFEEAEYETESI